MVMENYGHIKRNYYNILYASIAYGQDSYMYLNVLSTENTIISLKI